MTFVVSDDDLDWEFVFDSHFEHPTGSSEEPMVKRAKRRCEELPILHPHAAGIDGQMRQKNGAACAGMPEAGISSFIRDLAPRFLSSFFLNFGLRRCFASVRGGFGHYAFAFPLIIFAQDGLVLF